MTTLYHITTIGCASRIIWTQSIWGANQQRKNEPEGYPHFFHPTFPIEDYDLGPDSFSDPSRIKLAFVCDLPSECMGVTMPEHGVARNTLWLQFKDIAGIGPPGDFFQAVIAPGSLPPLRLTGFETDDEMPARIMKLMNYHIKMRSHFFLTWNPASSLARRSEQIRQPFLGEGLMRGLLFDYFGYWRSRRNPLSICNE